MNLFGGRICKKEVGQLPTKLIEITPLNSVEFLLTQKKEKRRNKELSPLQKNWGGGLSTPSIIKMN
jgi:hypothetical protein